MMHVGGLVKLKNALVRKLYKSASENVDLLVTLIWIVL